MKTSNSAIQTFKACRRLYELKHIHGLEPVKTPTAIERGLAYHDLVEKAIKGELNFSGESKIDAMVSAFQDKILPHLPQINETEKWFSYKTPSNHEVVGRIDALTESGTVVEHKTVSGLIDGSYFMRLPLDEQIPTYMLAMNSDKVYYTVCATPTIRQRKNESNQEFFVRCRDWFEENEEQKIKLLYHRRTDEELETFMYEQDAIIGEMASCKNYYRNPSHCMKYGRLCEYASVCMNYDPDQDYIQFKRRIKKDEKIGEADF